MKQRRLLMIPLMGLVIREFKNLKNRFFSRGRNHGSGIQLIPAAPQDSGPERMLRERHPDLRGQEPHGAVEVSGPGEVEERGCALAKRNDDDVEPPMLRSRFQEFADAEIFPLKSYKLNIKEENKL